MLTARMPRKLKMSRTAMKHRIPRNRKSIRRMHSRLMEKIRMYSRLMIAPWKRFHRQKRARIQKLRIRRIRIPRKCISIQNQSFSLTVQRRLQIIPQTILRTVQQIIPLVIHPGMRQISRFMRLRHI